MLVPGSKAPDFNVPACVSIEKGKEFKNVSLADYAGKKWVILYSYPKDFTFVCPTEIVEFDHKAKEFADRDAVVLGGSTDNEFSHLAWRKDHKDLAKINHPLLFITHQMAADYGLVQPSAGAAVRATYIIDPQGIVRHVSANDLSVGRNVAETLRILDGFQTGELCACDWKKGEETLSQKLKKQG